VNAAFAATLDRIAVATSIIRTREQDRAREALHGARGELLEHVDKAAAELDQLRRKLEKAL
jgi:hypothetical protein